jgi:VWFA-related protein
VIRAEARLVLIDATVRDKQGKLVNDLGAGDFRLWEDGKEQPIANFSREAGPQYVLFLFDRTALPKIRQSVADIAGAYADPKRYMAVANFGGPLEILQNFTSVADRVQRAAVDLSLIPFPVAQPPNTVMAPSASGRGSNPVAMQAAQNAQQNAYASLVLGAIRDLADGMAAVHGRKLIVVVGGRDLDISRSLGGDFAVRACNRADVSVYATSGSLESLAKETGGRWMRGDLARELGNVIDDQDQRYVLGFKPVESRDGSCHSLRVKTVQSGLQVNARDGYCNTKAPDLLAGKIEGKALEERANGPSAGNAASSIELPYFYDSPGVALVDLAMEMDLAGLKFNHQDGKEHAVLNLVGLAYGEDGGVAGRFSDSVPLDFDATAQANAFRKQPYRYERQFRLPAGKYNVRVAFGSGDQSLGKAEAPLTVEPWDGHRLALGGIALSGETSQVAGLTSDLDPSLLEGHRELIANSIQLAPSGVNRFHTAEPCYAYLEIYGAAVGTTLDMRILDAAAGQAKLAARVPPASFSRPGAAVVPLILSVPIASLSPGAYTLELRVASSAGENITRAVNFSID